MEGHYIRGYGDTQKPDVEIELMPGAVEAADQFLSGYGEKRSRLARVARLIEGFETPYGMELLFSVHWVARRSIRSVTDGAAVIEGVHGWNAQNEGCSVLNTS